MDALDQLEGEVEELKDQLSHYEVGCRPTPRHATGTALRLTGLLLLAGLMPFRL